MLPETKVQAHSHCDQVPTPAFSQFQNKKCKFGNHSGPSQNMKEELHNQHVEEKSYLKMVNLRDWCRPKSSSTILTILLSPSMSR